MVHSSYRLLLTRHVKDIKLLSISHRGDRSFCSSRQSSGKLMICVIMDVFDEDRNNNGPKTIPCSTPDVTKTSSDLTPSRTIR